MAGRIIVDRERCKGCGLCVVVCPNQVIKLSDKPNSMGYFPAEQISENCTGCTACALTCPDVAIVVLRDNGSAGDKQAPQPVSVKETL